jgi:hypothetical protein
VGKTAENALATHNEASARRGPSRGLITHREQEQSGYAAPSA